MPQPLSERTASFTDSVIRRMTRVSLKYGAVNLSQGFPDFDPPQAILERLAQVAREVGVGAVPGSSFFREPVNHLIRLHFAKNDDTLNEALNRLEKIQKLKK